MVGRQLDAALSPAGPLGRRPCGSIASLIQHTWSTSSLNTLLILVVGALPALAITGGQLDTDNEYPNVGGLMVYDYRVDIPETLDFIDEVIAA